MLTMLCRPAPEAACDLRMLPLYLLSQAVSQNVSVSGFNLSTVRAGCGCAECSALLLLVCLEPEAFILPIGGQTAQMPQHWPSTICTRATTCQYMSC